MGRDPEDETCLSLLFANQVTDRQYSCTQCIKLVLFADRGGYLAEEGAGGRAGGAPRQVEAVIHVYSEQNWFCSRFKLWYTVDRPGEGWQYSSGFVSAEIIQKALFPPSGDNLVRIHIKRNL